MVKQMGIKTLAEDMVKTPDEIPTRGFSVGELVKLVREIDRDLYLVELYHHDIDTVVRYTSEIRKKLNKILEVVK